MTGHPQETDPIALITAERDRLLEIVTAPVRCVPRLPRLRVDARNSPAGTRLTRAQGSVRELVDGAQLEYRAVAGTVCDYPGLRLDAATSTSGLCVAQKRMMYSRDTGCDPLVDAVECKKISRSMLVVPLFRGLDASGVPKAVSPGPKACAQIDEHAG